MQCGVGANTVDHQLIQRLPHLDQCGFPGIRKGNQFADETVVMWRHGIAAIDVRIDSHTVATGRMKSFDGPRRGHEGAGVLGVNPALD